MSRYISKKDKNIVTQRATHRCEYCKIHQDDSFLPFEIEHIISIKHGGGNELKNLALACPHCNQHKGTDLTTFLDSYSNIIRLFNPRTDAWEEHFETDFGEIIPKTNIGKATVKLLKLNEPERLILRQVLAESGSYP